MATWAEPASERRRTGESPASRPYGVDVSATDEDAHVVGLATETAQLEALLRRPCAGGPVVAVVEGPAGIGKTTLLRRFLRRHPEVPTTAATGLPAHRPAATDYRSPGSAWPTVSRSGHRLASAVRSHVGMLGTLG